MSGLILSLALFAAPADAEPCVFAGNVGDYVSCIGTQADDAEVLALDNAARLDAADTCDAGYTALGNSCIDLTCRGDGEDVDTDIITVDAAETVCADLGGRICTRGELVDATGSGCGFDSEYVPTLMANGSYKLVLRGTNRESDGSCNGGYNGEYYAANYNSLEGCSTHSTPWNADDNIDGFLCCQ